jgi:hypothetical protein
MFFFLKSYLIAFGLENGRIDLFLWNLKDDLRPFITVSDR